MNPDPIRYNKIQLIPPAFPAKGMLLLSSPKLEDEQFYRTVVLILKHSLQGSFGLILNKFVSIQDDFLPVGMPPFPLFQGGPVSKSSLFFIHDLEDVDGAKQIVPGVFWGGKISPFLLFDDKIRKKIFLGASSWAPNQLNLEMQQKFWIPILATQELVFSSHSLDDHPDDFWKKILLSLGGLFPVLVSFPKDPTLN